MEPSVKDEEVVVWGVVVGGFAVNAEFKVLLLFSVSCGIIVGAAVVVVVGESDTIFKISFVFNHFGKEANRGG